MKFSGEIRVPGIDHPGVPGVFLVDDVQVEVVVEGESLGRWSLHDVHAWRLVSSTFLVDLAGEELTFLAEDPTDFAYRGVEHMAEAWARFKSMNVAARRVAVRRSRKGVTPSRISALRDLMVENLAFEHSGSPARDAGLHRPKALQSESLEAEKRAIDEERARLEAEMQSLETERLEAEQMEADRVEGFRLEMDRLESELEDQQRLEAKRSEASRQELERLQAELTEMERLAERKELERLESERIEVAKAQAELEQQRADMDLIEAERAKSAHEELASIEKKLKEIERFDAERAERARLDAERREAIEAEMEQLEAQLAEDLAQEAAVVEHERADAYEALDEGAVEETPTDIVTEPFSTSGSRDGSEGHKQLVDLGEFEKRSAESEPDSDPDSRPEPAFVGARREESGVMGAVKGAFSRNGRNHVHQFVEAPGGQGIGRSICDDCGYISISISSSG